jgi:hypothetical protein
MALFDRGINRFFYVVWFTAGFTVWNPLRTASPGYIHRYPVTDSGKGRRPAWEWEQRSATLPAPSGSCR